MTITVGESSNLASGQPDTFEWSLFSYDKHNEKQHQYRLHTVDLYLWTASDANMFLDALQKVLKDHQLHVTDFSGKPTSHASQDTPPSTIAQKLEQMAIGNPQAARHSGITAVQAQGTTENQQLQHSANSSTTQLPKANGSENVTGEPAVTSAVDNKDYTPLAYNPAAPAAPEPIKHREKTPPPSDIGPADGFIAPGDHSQNFQSGIVGRRPVATVSPVPSHAYSSDSHSFVTTGAYQQPYVPSTSASHHSIPSSGFAPPPSVSPIGSQSGQGYQSPIATGAPRPPMGHSTSVTNPQNPGAPHPYSHPSFTSHAQGSITPSSNYAPQQPHPPPPPQQQQPFPGAQLPYQQHPPLSPQSSVHLQQSNSSQPYNPYLQAGSAPSFQPPPGGYVSGPYDPQQQQQQQHQYGQQAQLQNPYDQQQSQYYQQAPGQAPGASSANAGSFGTGPKSGRFEKNAQMLEKGVNRFLKKLDKKV